MSKYRPRIAVITPYYKEDVNYLTKCHESVIEQGELVDHILVSDGYPNSYIDGLGVKHIKLPSSHDDNGNTPRGIGSIYAGVNGYDFVAYLDADNWYQAGHLTSLLNLYTKTGAEICTSFRTYHDISGAQLMDVYDQDELALNHVDTSCFLLSKKAYSLFDVWLKMPKILAPICDRIFLSAVKHANLKFVSTRLPTVAFRTQYKFHYQQAHMTPPPEAKSGTGADAVRWLKTIEGVREVTTKLGFYPL
jgi:glycosyltransferase involved in cell wall biosynthesis